MSSDDLFDDIKRYLPQYLSDESAESLYQDLVKFPGNLDARFYTTVLPADSAPLQGDGIQDMMVVQIPNPRVAPVPCVLVSNSCDIAIENQRLAELRVLYAPILNLRRYEEALRGQWNRQDSGRINAHLEAIRNQRVSNVLYLPEGAGQRYEGMVRLDMIQNGPVKQLHDESIGQRRRFSLSTYGFYIFLLKLSIHFTRVRERVQRD